MIYKIEWEDFYQDLKNKDAFFQEYDFSKYNEDNRLLSKHQKLETLKFKNEMDGKILHGAIALKSKLYSISMGDKQKLCKRNHQVCLEKSEAPSILSNSCKRCFTQNFELYNKLWKT